MVEWVGEDDPAGPGKRRSASVYALRARWGRTTLVCIAGLVAVLSWIRR